MKAKTIKGITTAEIQMALDQSIREGFNPSLAIILLSNQEDAESLRECKAERFKLVFSILLNFHTKPLLKG